MYNVREKNEYSLEYYNSGRLSMRVTKVLQVLENWLVELSDFTCF